MEWMPLEQLHQLYGDQLRRLEQYIRDFENPSDKKDDNWKPKVSREQLYLMRGNLRFALSLMGNYKDARAHQRGRYK